MIVVYATFEFGAQDRAGFQAWYEPLAAEVRSEPGCIIFDLLFDPTTPRHGTFFEVWESDNALKAHANHPAHKAMVDGGKERFGWQNYHVNLWMDAQKHLILDRARLA